MLVRSLFRNRMMWDEFDCRWLRDLCQNFGIVYTSETGSPVAHWDHLDVCFSYLYTSLNGAHSPFFSFLLPRYFLLFFLPPPHFSLSSAAKCNCWVWTCKGGCYALLKSPVFDLTEQTASDASVFELSLWKSFSFLFHSSLCRRRFPLVQVTLSTSNEKIM